MFTGKVVMILAVDLAKKLKDDIQCTIVAPIVCLLSESTGEVVSGAWNSWMNSP